MKTGIVICTRTDSERLPNKPFKILNGLSVIEHLIRRLQKASIPIYLAVPKEQIKSYKHLSAYDFVQVYPSGHYEDPLARMAECAIKNDLNTVIRVSHDKIFVEESDIKKALQTFKEKKSEYLYGTEFIPGTGFEIISRNALEEASRRFKKVEYIGYAVRTVTNKITLFNPRHPPGTYRFLIDFPEDLDFLEVLCSQVGNEAKLSSVIKYLNLNPEIGLINAQPKVTVYTCARNAESYLEKCMQSVENQNDFKQYEYILIDDYSTDKTCEKMARFCLKNKNATWIRNSKNLGLSSSSNIALKKARGKYIMRLDADDFLVSIHGISDLVREIEKSDKEIIYPDNYFGRYEKIQKGNEFHHVGGALFDRSAITHLKFTDGLMGHDSLDIFLRAKRQLKIGYLNKPIFFYRQSENSMSKTNIKQREIIKRDLIKKYDDVISLEDL